MGYFFDGKLYKWGSPFALLAFRSSILSAKFRYALHVMVTKNVSDWSGLDKVNATEWLRKWLGKRGYERAMGANFPAEVLRVHRHLSAAWMRDADQAHRPLAQELVPGKLGVSGGARDDCCFALERFITAFPEPFAQPLGWR